MPTLHQMLMTSQLDRQATFHCNAGAANEVAAVQMFEDLHDVLRAKRGALVVFTAAASREAISYKLDMVIRRAAQAQAAGLVLLAVSETSRMLTSVPIAERAGLSVVSIEATRDLAEVVKALTAALYEDVDQDLERARAALLALDAARGRGTDAEEMVDVVSDLLGVTVALTANPTEDPRLISDPIVVDGERQMVLRMDPTAHEPTILRLMLAQLGRAVEHSVADARRASEAPAASRAALLGELLLGEPEPSEQILRRARRLGLSTDDWYASVYIGLDNLSELVGNDEIARHHAALTIARTALEHVSKLGGVWHRAGFANSILLIRAERDRPPPEHERDVVTAAQQVLDRLKARRPDVTAFCGVGGGHLGFDGMRLSFAESRSGAARARLAGDAFRPYTYVGVGFRRLLLQWYSLEDANEMVSRLLAPLTALNGRQRTEALRTLRSYLDNGGAASKAATDLGLHRNTVIYRIDRLFRILDLDREDPDHRLMLQLACHAVSP